MSLLDTASLIVTPNGYKEGKLYSVIPSDGSGDLSVTRATTATRVNSAGLVELVPYNLLQYSQQFTNAIWTPRNGTFTDNFATAPDGTLTASRWVATDADPYVYQGFTGNGGNYVASVYVKGVGSSIGKTASIRVSGTLSNFTITGEWQRVQISTTISTSVIIGCEVPDPAVIGDTIYIWGFQLVEGSVAKDYQKTETRLNIPRLDYSNGTCPSLLVEPQRTNLLTYSSSFDNSDWGKIGITAFANNTTAPNGTMSADKIAFTNTNSYIYPTAVVFAITNNSFSYSVYAKADTQSAFNMLIGTPVGVWGANFDLTTQTATPFSGSGTSGKIESVGNGWFRCILTAPIPVVVYAEASIGFPIASGSLFFWGAQIEAGAYPTSYIPTTSASVTRNADKLFKTSATALIGQTEGTIFASFANPAKEAGARYFSLSDGTAGDRIDVYAVSPTEIGIYASKSYGAIVNTSFNVPANLPLKYAVAYKAGQWAWYLNGVQIGTSSNTNIPTLTDIQLTTDPTQGAAAGGNPVNAAALWKTRLTNTQLASLTTL